MSENKLYPGSGSKPKLRRSFRTPGQTLPLRGFDRRKEQRASKSFALMADEDDILTPRSNVEALLAITDTEPRTFKRPSEVTTRSDTRSKTNARVMAQSSLAEFVRKKSSVGAVETPDSRLTPRTNIWNMLNYDSQVQTPTVRDSSSRGSTGSTAARLVNQPKEWSHETTASPVSSDQGEAADDSSSAMDFSRRRTRRSFHIILPPPEAAAVKQQNKKQETEFLDDRSGDSLDNLSIDQSEESPVVTKNFLRRTRRSFHITVPDTVELRSSNPAEVPARMDQKDHLYNRSDRLETTNTKRQVGDLSMHHNHNRSDRLRTSLSTKEVDDLSLDHSHDISDRLETTYTTSKVRDLSVDKVHDRSDQLKTTSTTRKVCDLSVDRIHNRSDRFETTATRRKAGDLSMHHSHNRSDRLKTTLSTKEVDNLSLNHSHDRSDRLETTYTTSKVGDLSVDKVHDRSDQLETTSTTRKVGDLSVDDVHDRSDRFETTTTRRKVGDLSMHRSHNRSDRLKTTLSTKEVDDLSSDHSDNMSDRLETTYTTSKVRDISIGNVHDRSDQLETTLTTRKVGDLSVDRVHNRSDRLETTPKRRKVGDLSMHHSHNRSDKLKTTLSTKEVDDLSMDHNDDRSNRLETIYNTNKVRDISISNVHNRSNRLETTLTTRKVGDLSLSQVHNRNDRLETTLTKRKVGDLSLSQVHNRSDRLETTASRRKVGDLSMHHSHNRSGISMTTLSTKNVGDLSRDQVHNRSDRLETASTTKNVGNLSVDYIQNTSDGLAPHSAGKRLDKDLVDQRALGEAMASRKTVSVVLEPLSMSEFVNGKKAEGSFWLHKDLSSSRRSLETSELVPGDLTEDFRESEVRGPQLKRVKQSVVINDIEIATGKIMASDDVETNNFVASFYDRNANRGAEAAVVSTARIGPGAVADQGDMVSGSRDKSLAITQEVGGNMERESGAIGMGQGRNEEITTGGSVASFSDESSDTASWPVGKTSKKSAASNQELRKAGMDAFSSVNVVPSAVSQTSNTATSERLLSKEAAEDIVYNLSYGNSSVSSIVQYPRELQGDNSSKRKRSSTRTPTSRASRMNLSKTPRLSYSEWKSLKRGQTSAQESDSPIVSINPKHSSTPLERARKILHSTNLYSSAAAHISQDPVVELWNDRAHPISSISPIKPAAESPNQKKVEKANRSKSVATAAEKVSDAANKKRYIESYTEREVEVHGNSGSSAKVASRHEDSAADLRSISRSQTSGLAKRQESQPNKNVQTAVREDGGDDNDDSLGLSPLATPHIDMRKTQAPPDRNTSDIRKFARRRSGETPKKAKAKAKVPKQPAKPRKSKVPTRTTAMPKRSVKFFAERHSTMKLSKDAVDEIEQVSEVFWDMTFQALEDAAVKEGRKTVTDQDVVTLMKGLGVIKDTEDLYDRIREFLPMELRAELIPVAKAALR